MDWCKDRGKEEAEVCETCVSESITMGRDDLERIEKERDEARAEVERLRKLLRPFAEAVTDTKALGKYEVLLVAFKGGGRAATAAFAAIRELLEGSEG